MTDQSQKLRRDRRLEEGLCGTCGTRSPMIGKRKCKICQQRRMNQLDEVRRRVFEAYGGYICSCCGETEPKFLTIDHIGNNGHEERKILSSGQAGLSFYRVLIRLGFPAGYQVLCWNCNCGRAANNGICPHNEKRFIHPNLQNRMKEGTELNLVSV